jgi:hypothetical protein
MVEPKILNCIKLDELLVRQVDNRTKILKILQKNEPLCDDCLSKRSGVSPRQQVNQICLNSITLIVRSKQTQCSHCGDEPGRKIKNHRKKLPE